MNSALLLRDMKPSYHLLWLSIASEFQEAFQTLRLALGGYVYKILCFISLRSLSEKINIFSTLALYA